MNHYILIYHGSELIYMKKYEDINLALSESNDFRKHIIDTADVVIIFTNNADRVKEAVEDAKRDEEKHPFAI